MFNSIEKLLRQALESMSRSERDEILKNLCRRLIREGYDLSDNLKTGKDSKELRAATVNAKDFPSKRTYNILYKMLVSAGFSGEK